LLSKKIQGQQSGILGEGTAIIWRVVGVAVTGLGHRRGYVALPRQNAQAASLHKGLSTVSDLLLVTVNQEDCRIWAISPRFCPENLDLFVAVAAVPEKLSTYNPTTTVNKLPFFYSSAAKQCEQK
jgi:hypothetical protein